MYVALSDRLAWGNLSCGDGVEAGICSCWTAGFVERKGRGRVCAFLCLREKKSAAVKT